jgi:beta-galactosidase
VINRSNSTDSFTFLINHSDAEVEYPARGRDLLTGEPSAPVAVIPGGTVRVIHSQEGGDTP